MASLEQTIKNEIHNLNIVIAACRPGQDGLKNEYIAARQAYNHILVELKGAEVPEKRKYGYDIPEDNVRTNGFIELLESQIEREREWDSDECASILDWAIRQYRNYLDSKQG